MKKFYTLILMSILAYLPGSSWAQPLNDDCANAIPVLLDEIVTFSTIDATTAGPFHPLCISSQNDTILNDIWYSYTAGFSGHVHWSLCFDAFFDTKIAVYQGNATCPLTDADLLACNDDAQDCDVTSVVEFDVVTGETYLLRLGGWNGEEGDGSFIVEQYTPPVGPPNNLCSNAQVITLGLDQPFTTVGATTDGPGHTGTCFLFSSNTAESDVWYSFTSPFTGFVQWSTCGEASFDTRLAIYVPGSPCPPTGDIDLYACNDDGQDCAEYTSKATFAVQEGETYLMRLGGYQASGTGTFDLEEVIPPVPPANDLCENPDTAFVMSAMDADLFNYTFEGSTENCQTVATLPVCTTYTTGEYSDVWYRFNSLGNDTIQIRFYSLDPLATFYVELHNDCLTHVDTALYNNACFIIDETQISATLDWTGFPAEPTWYYLRVSTRLTSQSPGGFNFQLVADITDIVSNEEVLSGKLSIDPNPVSDKLKVSYFPDIDRQGEIAITNALGEKIWQKNNMSFSRGGQQELIDVSGFLSGMYFLTITSEAQSITKRFVKQ